MTKLNILLAAILLLPGLSGFCRNEKTDSLLNVLKDEINKEHVYDLRKEKHISILEHRLNSVTSTNYNTRYNILAEIFEEYRSFKFDSAFVYARKMIAVAKASQQKNRLTESQISLCSILLNSGFYKEAFEAIGQIDTNNLSNITKSDYLVLRARLNQGIGDYDNDAYFSQQYHQQSEADFQRAETTTPPNDFERTISMAFLPVSERDKKMTPYFFYNLIMARHLSEHGIAMVATRISYAYTGEDRVLFLALAAINDIRSSTKETLASFLIAQELFKLNRTTDAYVFMQEAVKNAMFYGARNRAVQIESILPLIASKMIDEKQHEKDKVMIGFLIFAIVAVVLVFLLVIYRKQMLRIKASEIVIKEKNSELEEVNNKLWESSRIKEELIGLFFKTCSTYIEMLDKVTRKTQHNIKIGKYAEAMAVLNNVQIEKEKDQLYHTIDSVFLTLFPKFITSFNALLRKEDQIWPKQGEALNATLRIFALIRLGINDQETIAKILDYSVSTVYTYKVRVKAKAVVPADDFEQKIMEIKFIDEL